MTLTLVPTSKREKLPSKGKTVYVPFLVTEQPVLVYVKITIERNATREDFESAVRDAHQQFCGKGILAEPTGFNFDILDKIPPQKRNTAGTVNKLVGMINHKKI